MTWEEVDWDTHLWTIPAVRMESGKIHHVPLSEAVVALLGSLKPPQDRPAVKVFHNGKGSSLSNMAMTAVLRRMGTREVTVHGFRSTFRDWAGEKTKGELA